MAKVNGNEGLLGADNLLEGDMEYEAQSIKRKRNQERESDSSKEHSIENHESSQESESEDDLDVKLNNKALKSMKTLLDRMFKKQDKSMDKRCKLIIDKKVNELECKVGITTRAQGAINDKVLSRLATLEGSCAGLVKENKQLRTRVNDLENRSKRQNIIFSGLWRGPGETTAQCEGILAEFCFQQLGIQNIQTNRCHRLPTGSQQFPDMIANFTYQSEVDLIFQRLPRLKGTKFFVRRDLCADSRKIMEALRNLRGELFKKKIKTTLGFDCLFQEQDRYTVNDCMELKCGSEDGCELLKSKFGLDAKAMWEGACVPYQPKNLRSQNANQNQAQQVNQNDGQQAVHNATQSSQRPENVQLQDPRVPQGPAQTLPMSSDVLPGGADNGRRGYPPSTQYFVPISGQQGQDRMDGRDDYFDRSYSGVVEGRGRESQQDGRDVQLNSQEEWSVAERGRGQRRGRGGRGSWKGSAQMVRAGNRWVKPGARSNDNVTEGPPLERRQTRSYQR